MRTRWDRLLKMIAKDTLDRKTEFLTVPAVLVPPAKPAQASSGGIFNIVVRQLTEPSED